ncbi:hypothetical protein HU200_003808 [Digitaria exilis]|uniref:Uncharacterized protein n=1 Tax=Digitaria exilis TaxID=1010633 RepID=A0A835KUA9_9POAL|nr:hypothetical protein HU200_003808 [Digitaria exilis]
MLIWMIISLDFVDKSASLEESLKISNQRPSTKMISYLSW